MTQIEDIQRSARDLVYDVTTDSAFRRVPVITVWLGTLDRFELEVLASKLLCVTSQLAALPKCEVES
jgi:hypothetical protein